MIAVEKNQIISIRERTTKTINNVKNVEEIKQGDNVIFSIKDNIIKILIGYECVGNLSTGVLNDIVKDLLLNKNYKYRAKIEETSIEDKTITIDIEIYRIIDLENDPFVIKKDFQLTKTTKKDFGVPRQDNFYKTNIMDNLYLYRSEDTIHVCNQSRKILGEIGSKGLEDFYDNNWDKLIVKLLKKSVNESGNYTGTIRVYEIVR